MWEPWQRALRRSAYGVAAWTISPSGRRRLVGYGVPTAVALAATDAWFSPGRFFATTDVAPYLRTNLAAELTESWNHQVTGAGSRSYAITQALDVALLAAARVVGASPVVAQHALYALAAGLAAFGAAYLAGAWVSHPLARMTAGLLGAFNVFLLVNYPNMLPTLAVGLTGLLVGMVLRAARGRPPRPIALAAATLPASYLAQNPPLLVLAAAAVAAAALGATFAGRGAAMHVWSLLARALPWVALLNLWWLVPYAQALFAGGEGVTFAAQTDVGAWAWTQVRTSLANVLTLNATWGWNDVEYYPYAAGMDAGLWPVLRWMPPALAAAGVLLADRARRRAAWSLAGVAAVLAFIAKGIHPPLGSVNLWLYAHVPGMWLFRDPMSKLGVPLVLTYAALAALAVQRIAELDAWRPTLPVRAVHLARIGALVAVVGALVYPWPLWTGDVAPHSRGLLPSARVAVPADWQRLADQVNADPAAGKVLILPLDPYYLVNTAWGYYGVDAVPAQLVRRPVLQQLPGGYFSAGPEVNALLNGVQSALLTGDEAAVAGRLRVLGVSHVLVRHDLRANPHAAPPADADRIEETLRRVPRIVATAAYPVATVYRYTGPTGPVQAQQRLVGAARDDPAGVSATVGTLGDDTALTTGREAPASGFSWQTAQAPAATTFAVDRAGRYDVTRPADAVATYRATVAPDPGHRGGRLTLTDAETIRLDGQPVPARPSLEIPLDEPDPVGLVVDGQPEPLDGDRTVVTVGTATDVTAYAISPRWSSLLGNLREADDCTRHDAVDTAPAGPNSAPAGSLLTLTPPGRTTCAWAPVTMADSGMYRVQLSYRTSVGNSAGVCLWQVGLDGCADLPAPTPGEDWQRYSAVVRAEPGATALRLHLYAYPAAGGSTVEYRDVRVEGLRAIGGAVLSAPQGRSVAHELSAGEHRVDVAQSVAANQTTVALQECPGPSGAPQVRRTDDGVGLSARAGTVCVRTGARATGSADAYLVSFDYQTIAGLPARACLWQDGPNRCAALPSLPVGHDWRTLTTTVHPEPGTRAVVLYLYADGQENQSTSVAYRNVRIAHAPVTGVVVSPADGARPGGAAVSLGVASAHAYQARIRGATGPFVLTLTESYASGWRIRGLPRDWHATHFRVNGYANGWLISGSGDATVTLEYQPQRWTRAAIAGSGGAATVAVFLPVLRWIRRQRVSEEQVHASRGHAWNLSTQASRS